MYRSETPPNMRTFLVVRADDDGARVIEGDYPTQYEASKAAQSFLERPGFPITSKLVIYDPSEAYEQAPPRAVRAYLKFHNREVEPVEAPGEDAVPPSPRAESGAEFAKVICTLDKVTIAGMGRSGQ